MKRAIQLLRVSTLGQASDDHASLESQRTLNQRTADQYGFTIVKTIELAGVSGTAVLLTPEFREMIRLMADPEIHAVIAREFSRLMRPENYADYALLQVFVDTNTLLVLPDGAIDFSSNDGRLMGTLKASIAGNVRREMLKAAWESRETKRRKGELAQARICLPFGVDNEKTRWWYTPDAEKIREAFRMVLEGETSYTVIGKQVGIEPQSLGRQGDRRKIQRAPEEIIRVKVIDDPLVSESDFALVQKILGMKKSFHWRTSPGYESRYTYNGYLDCVCRGPIYSKFRRFDYYICKDKCGAHYMRRERLEPLLDSMFAKRLSNPRFLNRIAKAKRPPQSNVEQVRKQIDALSGKRERVLDAYYDSVITETERNQKIAEIEREKQVFSDLLRREEPARLDADQLWKRFKVFRQFDLLSRDQKRRLLNTITPRIVVANYQVEGLLVGLPDSPTATAGFRHDQKIVWLPLRLAA